MSNDDQYILSRTAMTGTDEITRSLGLLTLRDVFIKESA
jgi:hypothetical protein